MVDKVKVTFVVPEQLQNEMRKTMVTEGYSLRGKSKWVAEAIQRLFKMSNFPELVNLGDEMSGFEKVETIVLERELKTQLDNAIITVRQQFPSLEGVQSSIIRTSILQRLLRV